jgi:hypothetical protein
MTYEDAIAAWRAVNAQAMTAERDVATAHLEMFEGNGKGPTDHAVEDAKRLRAEADVLLSRALVVMGSHTKPET